MPKHDHPVAVIIPVWNNWELTRQCLLSLAANTPEAGLQVVLADNGSTDQTPAEGARLGRELFGERFVSVRLEQNMGFARACNQGAWNSSAEFLFFLNNDTTVEPGWLPPLLDALGGDHRLAGVGPLLLFPEDDEPRSGRVQHLGIAVSPGPEFRHLYDLFPADHPVVLKRRKLQYATAAALLIRAELFRSLDGFHDGFLNGMEDVDLCYRVGRRGGYFSVIPESRVRHHTNRTPGRFEHELQNLELLRKRCRDADEDFGAYLAEDGFEPVFTPWLELFAGLPASRSRELERLCGGRPGLDELRRMVRAEPLWDQGYALLIRESLAQGDPAGAVTAAYLRSVLCPSLESYREYADLLSGLGSPELAKRTGKLLDAVERRLADSEGLDRKVAELERITREPGVLAALARWKRERAVGR